MWSISKDYTRSIHTLLGGPGGGATHVPHVLHDLQGPFFFEHRNITCRYKYRKLVTCGLHLSEKLWRTDSGIVTHELQMRYARTPPPIPFRTIVFLSTVYPLKLCYSLPFKGAPTAVLKLHLVLDQIVQSSWMCTHRTTSVPRCVPLHVQTHP